VTDPRLAARQLLDSWKMAGLTHVPRVAAPTPAPPTSPVTAAADSGSVEPAAETRPLSPPKVEAPPVTPPIVAKPLPEVVLTTPVTGAASGSRADRLAALAARVAQCVRCQELASTRKQTVFGVGDPNARVMFIGEAPGADEDAQGEPFVGRAGQLLTKIIIACGWKREDVYICNILRCRPPGNRTPLPTEAGNCREYLDGQIAVVDPDYIVCWGSCAAQNLLGMADPIGRMRGRFYQHGRAKVLCTYHPSYLLRNPEAKKPVWDDMKFLLAEMGLTPP
jgi:uracil-DNA glycosylase family 4